MNILVWSEVYVNIAFLTYYRIQLDEAVVSLTVHQNAELHTWSTSDAECLSTSYVCIVGVGNVAASVYSLALSKVCWEFRSIPVRILVVNLSIVVEAVPAFEHILCERCVLVCARLVLLLLLNEISDDCHICCRHFEGVAILGFGSFNLVAKIHDLLSCFLIGCPSEGGYGVHV